VKALHDQTLAEGGGGVELPYALAAKYPKAAWEWSWQCVFPAKDKSVDPRSGAVRRHHVD
jgi:predicted metalloenzyme YecM